MGCKWQFKYVTVMKLNYASSNSVRYYFGQFISLSRATRSLALRN